MYGLVRFCTVYVRFMYGFVRFRTVYVRVYVRLCTVYVRFMYGFVRFCTVCVRLCTALYGLCMALYGLSTALYGFVRFVPSMKSLHVGTFVRYWAASIALINVLPDSIRVFLNNAFLHTILHVQQHIHTPAGWQ